MCPDAKAEIQIELVVLVQFERVGEYHSITEPSWWEPNLALSRSTLVNDKAPTAARQSFFH
jgi:hypothetical protein